MLGQEEMLNRMGWWTLYNNGIIIEKNQGGVMKLLLVGIIIGIIIGTIRVEYKYNERYVNLRSEIILATGTDITYPHGDNRMNNAWFNGKEKQ